MQQRAGLNKGFALSDVVMRHAELGMTSAVESAQPALRVFTMGFRCGSHQRAWKLLLVQWRQIWEPPANIIATTMHQTGQKTFDILMLNYQGETLNVQIADLSSCMPQYADYCAPDVGARLPVPTCIRWHIPKGAKDLHDDTHAHADQPIMAS